MHTEYPGPSPEYSQIAKQLEMKSGNEKRSENHDMLKVAVVVPFRIDGEFIKLRPTSLKPIKTL